MYEGGRHGGDIYRNPVELDFSVSLNPLGVPGEVRRALHRAVFHCDRYPDQRMERLRQKTGTMLGVPQGWLIFGNGASELFMAVVHGLCPKKILVPVPSFYGYEHAANAILSETPFGGKEILFYETKAEKGFVPGEDFLTLLGGDVELVFLANPNNPTGRLFERDYLIRVLDRCRDRGIVVVLDECFIEFCQGNQSLLGELEHYDRLIVVRAFTKLFSIPGVRLGYALCSNEALRQKIQCHLPEWNLSVFAQEAGSVCARQSEFVRRSADYVKGEREFLADRLNAVGVKVLSGEANFLFVHSSQPLGEMLLRRKILIRDCSNFRGLEKGYYRIAVKSRAENEILVAELRELL